MTNTVLAPAIQDFSKESTGVSLAAFFHILPHLCHPRVLQVAAILPCLSLCVRAGRVLPVGLGKGMSSLIRLEAKLLRSSPAKMVNSLETNERNCLNQQYAAVVQNAKTISLQSHLLHFAMAWLMAQETIFFSLYLCINRVEGGVELPRVR